MIIMTVETLSEFILNRYQGLVPQNAWGETSFFYNLDFRFPRGTYFVTIKEKDGENDKVSNLNREGVFRLSFGTDKKDFLKLFGENPVRPGKSGVIIGEYDFQKLDTLMPHPVYGWASWVCILSPKKNSLKSILPLMDKYYEITKKRFEKKLK